MDGKMMKGWLDDGWMDDERLDECTFVHMSGCLHE